MKLYALLLLPLAASAQETLDYTSGPITSIVTAYQRSDAPTLGESVTGIITLGEGLPANGTTTVTPESVSFGINGSILASTAGADAGLLNGSFTFTTQNGAVTAFNFNQVTCWQCQNVFGIWSDSSTDTEVETTAWYTYSSPGTWFDPVGAMEAPEIDPSGTTAALTLLLGSLAVVRGRRASA